MSEKMDQQRFRNFDNHHRYSNLRPMNKWLGWPAPCFPVAPYESFLFSAEHQMEGRLGFETNVRRRSASRRLHCDWIPCERDCRRPARPPPRAGRTRRARRQCSGLQARQETDTAVQTESVADDER